MIAKKRWSRDVTEKSNTLDLDRGVFSWKARSALPRR
jgi:hypothetical protein